MEHAVESSKAAFKLWSKTSVMRRQQIMFRYQEIIKANMVNLFCRLTLFICLKYYFIGFQKKLSQNITLEQGKTFIDAEGDVTRGLRKIFNSSMYFDFEQHDYFNLYNRILLFRGG